MNSASTINPVTTEIITECVPQISITEKQSGSVLATLYRLTDGEQ